jgi:alpha-aminoadipate carrier protein LysW
MQTTPCPECEAAIAVNDDAVIGEITPCPDCGMEFEIVSVDPLELEAAPEIEEDWGE